MASTTHPGQPGVGSFRVRATPLARATIWSIGIYGVVQGVLILALGPARFSGLSYAVLRTVPGGYLTWGIVALILGNCILSASLTQVWLFKAISLIGLATWSMCFAAGLLLAALTSNTSGTTGVPTYILIAVCAAIVVWVDERKPAVP